MLVASYFLATFGFANFESTLSLLTKDSFGFTDDQNFLIFAFVGFVLVFVQGGIYRPIAHRFSEVTFIRIGVLFMMIGLGGVAAVAATSQAGATGTGNLIAFLGAMAVAITGFAFLNPSVSALISRRSDPARQGEVLGVNQSANAMSRILGPLIGNTLYRMTSNHVLPYEVAAVLLLIVLLLTPRLKAS